MAGALPVHMPVIITAVEAIAYEKTRFDTFEVSTGSWAPFYNCCMNHWFPVKAVRFCNYLSYDCLSGLIVSPGFFLSGFMKYYVKIIFCVK